MRRPQSPEMDPEKRAALRAFAGGLPAKKIVLDDVTWAEVFDTVVDLDDTEPRYGNRGLGGWQCTCGRFARFVRWQATGAPGYERGYLVNCKRCGEVLVY